MWHKATVVYNFHFLRLKKKNPGSLSLHVSVLLNLLNKNETPWKNTDMPYFMPMYFSKES